MDIFVDLNSKVVSLGAIGGETDKQLVKIRQTEDIRLKFHRAGTAELITASDAIFIGIKQTKASVVTLAQQTTWSHPGAATGWYTASLDLNTSEITDDLFDATDATFDTLECFLEITRTPSGGAVRRYDDAAITLQRSTFTGDEGAPTSADASAGLVWLAANGIARLADVTALTGGGITSLDGYLAITAVGSYIAVDISDDLQFWELVSATDATNAALGIVRHALYTTTTFERVWKQRG